MRTELIETVLAAPAPEAIERLLDADDTVFWVDWREEETSIVEYCEAVLKTGTLAAEIVDVETGVGYEMYVRYGGRRLKVPLTIGTADRHIALCALNDVLAPDYEIRLCIDSNGADTLAFLPLTTETWKSLEKTYGEKVNEHFYRLQPHPNVFTERLPF